MKDNEGPHPVDRHVGHRLRIRRAQLGLSQSAVAEAVGITFQQIQKYERGANRISASMLYELSGVLGTTTAYFFEGLSDDDAAKAQPAMIPREQEIYLASAEGRRVIEALMLMPQSIRCKFANLAIAVHRSSESDVDEG